MDVISLLTKQNVKQLSAEFEEYDEGLTIEEFVQKCMLCVDSNGIEEAVIYLKQPLY